METLDRIKQAEERAGEAVAAAEEASRGLIERKRREAEKRTEEAAAAMGQEREKRMREASEAVGREERELAGENSGRKRELIEAASERKEEAVKRILEFFPGQ